MDESTKPFRVTYDAAADAAYIYLQVIPAGGVERTVAVELSNGDVNIDFDSTGRMVGIEILGARALLPESFEL